jgi:DNA-binding CsgD family transcriptional regulator
MAREIGRDGTYRHRTGSAPRPGPHAGPRRLDRERARRLLDERTGTEPGAPGERGALARRLCGLALLLMSDGDPEVAAAACHEGVALLRQLDERAAAHPPAVKVPVPGRGGTGGGAPRPSPTGAGADPGDAEHEAGADAGDVEHEAGADPLSPREHEVVALVARGLPNGRIAEELFISKRTVESHVEHVKRKLGYASRTEVMAWAMRRALDPPA